MKYLTDCKKIETAIKRAKERLIKTAKTEGLSENFGQKERQIISDHFIKWDDPYDQRMKNIRAMEQFNRWAENYTPHGSW